MWAGGLALLLTKLGPLLAFGDTWVYDLLDDSLLDAAGGLDFLAVLDTVGNDCLCSVLVLDDLVGWEGGERLLVVFFRPVGAAEGVLACGGHNMENAISYPAGRDILAVFWCVCGEGWLS